jgi:hypothetical protein
MMMMVMRYRHPSPVYYPRSLTVLGPCSKGLIVVGDLDKLDLELTELYLPALSSLLCLFGLYATNGINPAEVITLRWMDGWMDGWTTIGCGCGGCGCGGWLMCLLMRCGCYSHPVSLSSTGCPIFETIPVLFRDYYTFESSEPEPAQPMLHRFMPCRYVVYNSPYQKWSPATLPTPPHPSQALASSSLPSESSLRHSASSPSQDSFQHLASPPPPRHPPRPHLQP